MIIRWLTNMRTRAPLGALAFACGADVRRRLFYPDEARSVRRCRARRRTLYTDTTTVPAAGAVLYAASFRH